VLYIATPTGQKKRRLDVENPPRLEAVRKWARRGGSSRAATFKGMTIAVDTTVSTLRGRVGGSTSVRAAAAHEGLVVMSGDVVAVLFGAAYLNFYKRYQNGPDAAQTRGRLRDA